MLHGIILTSAPNLQYTRSVMYAGAYTSIKVIPEWGVKWDKATRTAVSSFSRHLVVRGRHGDGLGHSPLPHWEHVLEEFRPWYQDCMPHTQLYLEIGNEPDHTQAPFPYGYHLGLAIDACRAAFPRAKFISPAISPNIPALREWWTNPNFLDAIKKFDFYGVHQYAFHHLITDDTRHGLNNKAYVWKNKPWMCTEMGINDPNTLSKIKIQRYNRFLTANPNKFAGAWDYHLCTEPIDEDQRRYKLILSDYD